MFLIVYSHFRTQNILHNQQKLMGAPDIWGEVIQ
jgi:hypothetical protein